MRLDLINSRFKVGLGPRIYDSIEGDLIEGLPASPKAISRASFLSKQNRLDYGPKSEPVPDRFSVAVVDRNGNFLPMDKTKRIRPANSVSTKKSLTFKDTMSVAQEPADALLLDAYPSKIADYMKDHIYDVKEDTVVNRIQSKKLPGGTWEVTGRKSTPPAHGNGPGDYDVYRTAPLKGGHFKTQPSGREHEEAIDPDYLPLKERQRYRRMKAAQDAKLEATLRSLSPHKLRSSLSALSVSDTLHTLDSSITGEDSNISPTSTLKRVKSTTGTLGGSGVKDRFDDKIYKQECFIKTSGMTLSGDWDKKLNKRIAFSFQPPSHNNKKSLRKPARSEGSDVDVDVGHMFSIVRTAELSPVKYSAAFRYLICFAPAHMFFSCGTLRYLAPRVPRILYVTCKSQYPQHLAQLFLRPALTQYFLC